MKTCDRIWAVTPIHIQRCRLFSGDFLEEAPHRPGSRRCSFADVVSEPHSHYGTRAKHGPVVNLLWAETMRRLACAACFVFKRRKTSKVSYQMPSMNGWYAVVTRSSPFQRTNSHQVLVTPEELLGIEQKKGVERHFLECLRDLCPIRAQDPSVSHLFQRRDQM